MRSKQLKQLNRWTRALLLLAAIALGVAASEPAQGQISVIILVDAANDGGTGPAYNKVHEDGLEALHTYDKKINHYQRYATGLTAMIYNREQKRLVELMEIDDYFSDNQEWKDMFEARLDTTRSNLDSLKVTIEKYPLAKNLTDMYDRLKEDIDDAEKKYKQVIEGKGQENMMRTADRNHLARLAEDKLEKSALTIYMLNLSVPHLRKRFEQGGDGLQGILEEGIPIGF